MTLSHLLASEGRLARSLRARNVIFGVMGHQVKVLTQPNEFYEELKHRMGSARHRVILSALYLGTGAKEKSLLQSLANNPFKPKTQILLDYFRGTRVNSSSDNLSSTKLLSPLVKPGSRISLYQTPSLTGLIKTLSPQRYNETFGLQHIKVYVFDDSVIISGANLSEDYFTNRQDRYILIQDCPGLADYFEELIDIIGDFSFQLGEKGDLIWSGGSPSIEKERGLALRERIGAFLSRKRETRAVEDEFDTLIYPSVQLGNVGIHDDAEFTSSILRSGSQSGGHMRFGTGYFNLTQDYMNIILREAENTGFDILMAHPTANGFYNAKGPAGGIPSAYTLIASQFYESIRSHKQLNRICMFEYQRPGWTFHGKGLWYYTSSVSEKDPIFTLIGSPNFGYRSVHRDIEAQIGILSSNHSLRKDLGNEASNIFSTSSLVSGNTYERPERAVPLWVKCVVRMARNFF